MLNRNMRSVIVATGVCVSGLLSGCGSDKSASTGESGGMGQIAVHVEAVPAAVSLVTATVGATTVDLTPDPNSDQATGSLDAAEGQQVLVVQAYNSSSTLLYIGRDSVTVIANTTVIADVQLVCVNAACDGGGSGTGTLGVYSMFPTPELEPNDLPASCNTPNGVVNSADPNPNNVTWMANGLVPSTNDNDYFCIPYVYAGDTITVTTYSSSLGSSISSLDPLVALVTPSLSYAGSDDNSGPGMESELKVVATQSGTWYLLVTTANAPSGSAPARYTVRVRDAY